MREWAAVILGLAILGAVVGAWGAAALLATLLKSL